MSLVNKIKHIVKKGDGLLFLLTCTALLLFVQLGSHEIWTQEHRWADIVTSMFYYHDFLHPILNNNEYYDKPLLSYWLISIIAALSKHLTTWALRIPSAIAGFICILSIFSIGNYLKGRCFGLLAGWLLLTTFYFIFWARTSSADMLNLGGILSAIAWYFYKKKNPSLWNYSLFFLIVVASALCKGLVAPVIIAIAVITDIALQSAWKETFSNWRLWFILCLAILLYMVPFWMSNHLGKAHAHYQSNGLINVYKENILRYFKAFDHKEPFYVYLIYLPLYLLPWTFLFFPAVFEYIKQWSALSSNEKWIGLVFLLLFIFFTLSGSRRDYYILPVVPFGILITTWWITSGNLSRYKLIKTVILFFYILWLCNYSFLQPLFYSRGGVVSLSPLLKKEISTMPTSTKWNYLLLDAETKVGFYLQIPPDFKNYDVVGLREKQTNETLNHAWPMLKTVPNYTIVISRQRYKPFLNGIFKKYKFIETEPTYLELFYHTRNMDSPIIYILAPTLKLH